ncbi:hypothetical protein Q4603_05775 [Zobellia galactanivorans]|uniref:hypothetical protein n=1 Tax=Zobellia galactanivorans (strain DSM 12802 / CCUG 47099 / CIP 106680 / NCIMB 13871 / Dsij) TaxID=63186 RepID=UPI0026E28D73|nr:hypothetical protein [Zobellia galactanivorans]MDO6808104.1 hypothetical protein [Zobellia galactanivorans]
MWVFKYHLNGTLRSFTVLDGMLDQQQMSWLFGKNNFPYTEEHMHLWQQKLKKHFIIEVGMPDTSFEAFWNTYGHKVHKQDAMKAYKKLNDADRIKALDGIRRYNNHLRLNTWKNKMDAARYIKGKVWEDEF